MMETLFVLADQTITTTSGAIAGWSSFGLAGMILAWLFLKHLPDKDKQIKDLLADHGKRMDEKDSVMLDKDSKLQLLLGEKDKQISAKDVQIERMLAVKNEQLALLVRNATEQQKLAQDSAILQQSKMHEENQRIMGQIIAHCKEEVEKTSTMVQKEMGRQIESMQYDIETLSKSIVELTSELKEFRMATVSALSSPMRRNIRVKTTDKGDNDVTTPA